MGSHDQEWEQQLGLFPGKPQGLMARVEVGGGGSDEEKGRRKGRGRGEREGKEVERTGGQRAEKRGRGRGRGPVGRGCSEEKEMSGAAACPQHPESPWFSAHSFPGLLIALATPWSHLWILRVFCFLGRPQGFQHVLVLKVGSLHT